MTVRLNDTLSSAHLDSSRAFAAVVDEPVLVDGVTILPAGLAVRGRVESARASEIRDTGWVRLTLNSISIEGKIVVVQTSSLFARASAREAAELSATPPQYAGETPSPMVIRLRKGRRLTFRLTSPIAVGNVRAVARSENTAPPPIDAAATP